jgi:hypothetical protein
MKRLACVLVFLATDSATVVHAQLSLIYPSPDARSTAMGLTGVADNSAPNTISFNPANVIASPRAYLDATHQSWGDDWFDDSWARRANAGAAWKSNASSAWTFGADLAYSKLQPPDLFLADYEEDVWSLTLGAGYATGAQSHVRFGGAVKRVDRKIPSSFQNGEVTTADVDGFAYDLGVAVAFASTTAKDWDVTSQFALALLDLGPDLDGPSEFSRKLPTYTGLGASVRLASPLHQVMSARVPMFASTFNFDARLPNEGIESYSLGMEAAVAQILFARGGLLLIPDGFFEGSQSFWGMGIGLPVQAWRFRLDYGKNTDTAFDRGQLSLLVLTEM